MPRRFAFITALILALTVLLSAQAPDTSQQRLAALLPTQAGVTFYHPDNLYTYMDGGADAFLLYDFKLLLHQDTRVKDTDLSIDIFDMGNPENSFGMYASERSPSYHYISMGTEGYDNEGILNFLQGPYYVKLAAFGTSAGSVLKETAVSISARIKSTGVTPAPFAFFPATNRKSHSEQFILKDPLGHPFLAPAYLARYSALQQESTLLLSIAADPADAQKRLQLLAAHFKSTGQCDPAPEFGDGAIRASNSFEGKAIAAAKGPYLLLLLNPVGDTIFKEALQRLD
jgi:hypothetical protein